MGVPGLLQCERLYEGEVEECGGVEPSILEQTSGRAEAAWCP
jgi:hypothetical protein